MKKVTFVIVFIIILISLGKSLNPFTNEMFQFHDVTQPARIQQFTLNIKNGQIPPRIAPDFSNKMGIPVFNFYAPTSYWFTGLINLIGFNIIDSIKISFLLAILVAFLASYLFFSNFFEYYPSLFGGILYITTLYFPIDIFVRGNLGETWFLALFPLCLYLIYKNSQKIGNKLFFFTIIILTLTLTVHNILSLIFVPFCIVYLFTIKRNVKYNFILLIVALLISTSFLLPAILELNLTHTKEIATTTNYNQHFLCPYQLWQSSWGYGGSVEGCQDGMSFKIGKSQIIFAILGGILFLINFKKNKKRIIPIFFLTTTFISLYLTTYQSRLIWDIFKPIFSLFQFPWRFISFSLIGIVFFAVYFWDNVKFVFKNIVIMVFLFITLILTYKYYYKLGISYNQFENQYLSSTYIEKVASYQVPEYLPTSVSLQSWKQYDSTAINHKELNSVYLFPVESINNNFKVIKNSSWYKEIRINQADIIKINLHYFPFWKITLDNKLFVPKNFDELGRPIIIINKPTLVKISYNQTGIEKTGNLITIISFVFLVIILANSQLWKKVTKYLT